MRRVLGRLDIIPGNQDGIDGGGMQRRVVAKMVGDHAKRSPDLRPRLLIDGGGQCAVMYPLQGEWQAVEPDDLDGGGSRPARRIASIAPIAMSSLSAIIAFGGYGRTVNCPSVTIMASARDQLPLISPMILYFLSLGQALPHSLGAVNAGAAARQSRQVEHLRPSRKIIHHPLGQDPPPCDIVDADMWHFPDSIVDVPVKGDDRDILGLGEY